MLWLGIATGAAMAPSVGACVNVVVVGVSFINVNSSKIVVVVIASASGGASGSASRSGGVV